MCMCVCACVCVHRCVCVYIEKSFSSVHLHISRLMPKPYPLPVLQERREKPVINREEPHKCSGFVSLRLKHSSPNESAGNYCSSAALQSTRYRHTRVECTTLQKKKRDPLPPACRTTCTGKAASLRGFPGYTRWVFTASYLQELLDPEGAVVLLSIWCGLSDGSSEQRPHSWSLQRQRDLILSLITAISFFVFFSLPSLCIAPVRTRLWTMSSLQRRLSSHPKSCLSLSWCCFLPAFWSGKSSYFLRRRP